MASKIHPEDLPELQDEFIDEVMSELSVLGYGECVICDTNTHTVRFYALIDNGHRIRFGTLAFTPTSVQYRGNKNAYLRTVEEAVELILSDLQEEYPEKDGLYGC